MTFTFTFTENMISHGKGGVCDVLIKIVREFLVSAPATSLEIFFYTVNRRLLVHKLPPQLFHVSL
jgi:hypothetical protein